MFGIVVQGSKFLLLTAVVLLLLGNWAECYVASWHKMYKFDTMPSGAVIAGLDEFGTQLFVGRAQHGVGVYPGMVTLAAGSARVAVGIAAYNKSEYESLLGSGFVWVNSLNGLWVRNAVTAGLDENGQQTFVCRATVNGGILIGSLTYAAKSCNIAYNAEGHAVNAYQVMTHY